MNNEFFRRARGLSLAHGIHASIIIYNIIFFINVRCATPSHATKGSLSLSICRFPYVRQRRIHGIWYTVVRYIVNLLPHYTAVEENQYLLGFWTSPTFQRTIWPRRLHLDGIFLPSSAIIIIHNIKRILYCMRIILKKKMSRDVNKVKD